MNNIDIKQRINALEQELLAATDKIADLERKIQEHRVGLSFDAVGKTDANYTYEEDLYNVILNQMQIKQQLEQLRAEFQR
jgi:predicted  nucleic acid-binding Zn-ribbon protein